MTELEIMQRAKMYLDKLAQGIDPISDTEVPEDSILNNVRLARCFFYVSGVLQQVIENGGRVTASRSQKTPFSITPQQLSRIVIPDHGLRITEFADLLLSAVNDPAMKRPNTTVITSWLVEQRFLQKVTGPDGKQRRIPTEAGLQLGLYTESRQGQYGTYEAVYYSPEAQQFLLEHIPEIFRPTND